MHALQLRRLVGPGTVRLFFVVDRTTDCFLWLPFVKAVCEIIVLSIKYKTRTGTNLCLALLFMLNDDAESQ